MLISAEANNLENFNITNIALGLINAGGKMANQPLQQELVLGYLHLVPDPLPPYKFVLKTVPAREEAVQDGDSLTVYCNTEDHENLPSIPQYVKKLYEEISDARLRKNYDKAHALNRKMSNNFGYRVLNYENKEILAQKFRIRLRGIDAPEHKMPFDDEAKNGLAELVKGQKLTIVVYGKDRYDRFVGDIYCNGVFIQWEKKAREDRVGLWVSPNPEAPWKWKQKQRQVQKADKTTRTSSSFYKWW
ncbi:hypothetical protein UlMin_032575 [Ulmus minor]